MQRLETTAEDQPRYLLARGLVILAVAVAMVGSSAPSPIYGLYQQRLGLDHVWLTVIYGNYSLGTVVALFVLGRISDRVADRRILLVAALGAAILGAVLMAAAGSLPMLLVGRFFAGMGTGCIMGPATAALVELDPRRDRVRAAIIATVAVTAGITSGILITAFALEARIAPLLFPFVVLGVSAVLLAIALPFAPWAPRDVLPATAHMAKQAKPSLGVLVREAGSGFWLSCAGMATAWMVGGCFLALGAIFARQLAGIHNPAVAGLTVAVFQVVAGCVQLGGRNAAPRSLVVAGVGLMITGLMLALLAAAFGSAALFGAGALFTGAGYGCAFSGSAAIGNRSAPARGRATIVSFTYIAGYLGNLIPVITLGIVADLFGLFAAIATLAGAAIIFGLLLAGAVRRVALA
jgi:MFS family permease